MHEPVLYDEDGKPYRRNVKNGKEYRYYLEKGVLPNDWWTDIQALNPAAKERLGYPMVKEALKEGFLGCRSAAARGPPPTGEAFRTKCPAHLVSLLGDVAAPATLHPGPRGHAPRRRRLEKARPKTWKALGPWPPRTNTSSNGGPYRLSTPCLSASSSIKCSDQHRCIHAAPRLGFQRNYCLSGETELAIVRHHHNLALYGK